MPIRGSQQVAEALKMLGVNLPAPAPMPDIQPGMPGYDPTTLANKIDNPSVMDPTWLNLLRTGQNTLERVGQMGKGLLTGGSETPGPSAENLGAILGAIGPLLSKIVYHGSPHVFDKFDMGKIGTGEGAQAYGHGLYFADKRGVAASYRPPAPPAGPKLTVDGEVFSLPAGKIPAEYTKEARGLSEIQKRMGGTTFSGDVQSVREDIQRSIANVEREHAMGRTFSGNKLADNTALAHYRDALTMLDKYGNRLGVAEKVVPGMLADVDLPDDAIAKMLDWDAPLSQQPEAVRAALRGSGWARDVDAIDTPAGEWFKSSGGVDKTVAEELRKMGIPGIRYYDGASRGAGQGTRNYVVFDDQIPKIVKVTR